MFNPLHSIKLADIVQSLCLGIHSSLVLLQVFFLSDDFDVRYIPTVGCDFRIKQTNICKISEVSQRTIKYDLNSATTNGVSADSAIALTVRHW